MLPIANTANCKTIDPPFETRFEWVTPARAQELLDTQPDHGHAKNRSLSLVRAERYIDDIRDGLWETTHQGVAVDENGVLMDGQHRLKAIVEADTPAPLMVCIGVPRDTFWLIDGGFTRNAQSFLEGTYGVQRTALARTWMRLEEFDGLASASTIGSGRYASHRILRTIEERADLREYGEAFSRAAVAAGKSDMFKGTSVVGLLLGGFIAGMNDPERRTAWWEDVDAIVHRDGLPEGNPVKALSRTSPVGGNMTNVNYMRAIYASVKYRDGEDLRRIRSDNYSRVRVW